MQYTECGDAQLLMLTTILLVLRAVNFLDADSRRQHQEGQAQLQQQLFSIISDYGACSNCQAVSGSKDDEAVSFVDLPIYNLLFDGKQMHQLDYSDYQQGIGCLCIE